MTALLIFLALFALLGIASARGWTVDTRDPAYGLGPIVDGPLAPPAR